MTRSAAAVALLGALVAAAATAPGYLFVNPDADGVKELTDAKLAEANADVKNPKNKTEIAIRVTDAGTAEHNKPAEAATKPVFKVIDFELPEIVRKGGGGGNRKSKYPIDDLQPGQAFFIPVGDDVKSPSKTYGSIASGGNKKYGDLAPGADFRFFETRSLDDGAAFGDEFKGKRGIVVGRLSAAKAALKRDDLIKNPPKPRKPRTPATAAT